MTRTAIRHRLSALFAVAVVSVVAGSPASAQSSHTHDIWSNDVIIDVAPTMSKNKPWVAKALTTKQRQTGKHIPSMMGEFVPKAD